MQYTDINRSKNVVEIGLFYYSSDFARLPMTNVHFLYHSMAGDFRQSKTAKVPRTSLRFGAPHFLRRIHQLLSTKDAASSGDILYRFDSSRTATSLLKLSSLSMAMILSLPSLMAIFRPSLRASVSISSIALHILLIATYQFWFTKDIASS